MVDIDMEGAASTPATSVHTSPPKKQTPSANTLAIEVETNMPFIMEDDDDMEPVNPLLVSKSLPDEPLPTVSAPPISEKAKGKMRATPDDGLFQVPKQVIPMAKVNLNLIRDDDSDSDGLEIVRPSANFKVGKRDITPKNTTDPSAKALLKLRQMARLQDPQDEKNTRNRRGVVIAPKISSKQLMLDLTRKNRVQIKQAQEEEKELLRLQGKYIPTDAERRKEKETVEDMVEAERLKDLALRELERKEEGNFEDDEDDAEDGDWLEDGEDDIELSGSEDELQEENGEEGNEEILDGLDESDNEVAMLDDNNLETFNAEKMMEDAPYSAQRSPSKKGLVDVEGDEDEELIARARLNTNKKTKRLRAVIEDEEDEAEETQVTSSIASPKKSLPFANMTSAPLPLGLTQMFNDSMESEVIFSTPKKQNVVPPLAGLGTQAAPFGLTQMFESSMEDSPVKSSISKETPSRQRMEALRAEVLDDVSISQIPLNFVGADDRIIGIVSQTQTQMDDGAESAQGHLIRSFQNDYDTELSQTQMTGFPDPTPDQGFVRSFWCHSTTVLTENANPRFNRCRV